jgi:DNA polymerase III epsilon subunit-like protein
MNVLTPSNNFIAIDVEYADNEQHICQIGIAKVENLEIIGSHSWLIQPPCDYYDEGPMRVHHLTPEDTAHAADFELVWQEVQPILLMSELWAHNAASTEQPILEKNLRMYGFNTDWLCVNDSRDLYQRPDCPANSGNSLPLCCKALGIEFDDTQHHDAEYDALKCAEIVIAHLKGQQPDWSGLPTNTEQLRKLQQEKRVLRLGEFAEYYAARPSGEEDVFAVLSSTDGSGTEQVIDVYDKGDRFKDKGSSTIDFARLDTRQDNPLRGRKVAITGMFRYSRKDIEKALAVMGAIKVPGITKNAAVVIVGTANVGPKKLIAIEEQEQKGHHIYRIVGDDDLDALLYGDGHKFFSE